MTPDAIQVVVIAVTTGLVEILKQADPEGKLNRFYPLFTEVLGFALGMLIGIDWLMSLTIGLAAMGIYRGAKVVIKGE